MNAYLVRTREEREYVEPILDDGSGPTFNYWPTGIFLAETPGKAKSDALRAWVNEPRSGVYADDWPALRVRLLERDVDFNPSRGELSENLTGLYVRLWARANAVLWTEAA